MRALTTVSRVKKDLPFLNRSPCPPMILITPSQSLSSFLQDHDQIPDFFGFPSVECGVSLPLGIEPLKSCFEHSSDLSSTRTTSFSLLHLGSFEAWQAPSFFQLWDSSGGQAGFSLSRICADQKKKTASCLLRTTGPTQ